VVAGVEGVVEAFEVGIEVPSLEEFEDDGLGDRGICEGADPLGGDERVARVRARDDEPDAEGWEELFGEAIQVEDIGTAEGAEGGSVFGA
jgi:hypothetical protein